MSGLDKVVRENIRIMAQVVTEVCQRNTRKQVCPEPLSRNQYYILNILAKSGDFLVSELARILDISSAAASKNIDRLENLGYVDRRTSKTDRRTMEIVLSASGRKIVDDFDRVTAEKQQPMMDNFTEEEKVVLLDLLRRIVKFTLAEQHHNDLICLQCGGACGNDCLIEALEGACRKSDSS